MGIAILMSAFRVQAADVPIATVAPVLVTGNPAVGHSTGVPSSEMLTDTLTLQEVTVNASFSDIRNTPLRLTTIDSEALRSRAASRTYPELREGLYGNR